MKKTIFTLSLLMMTAAAQAHAATRLSTCRGSDIGVNLREDTVSGFITVEAQHGYINGQATCIRTYTHAWACGGYWTTGAPVLMSVSSDQNRKLVQITRAYAGASGQNPILNLVCQEVGNL